MESITKKLKQNIMYGIKEDVVYDRQHIKQVIEKRSGMKFGTDYQESHLAGTLAALVKKGDLIIVERGKYKLAAYRDEKMDSEETVNGEKNENTTYSSMNSQGFSCIKNMVQDSVKKECDYLKEITCDMTLSLDTMEKRDISNMMRIKELIEYLESFRFS